jgi:hypothetical protein
MSAWLGPHNSAHCPVKVVPAWRAGILNQLSFTWPGTASILGPRLGIHHEWITSEAVISSTTVVSTGTTMS